MARHAAGVIGLCLLGSLWLSAAPVVSADPGADTSIPITDAIADLARRHSLQAVASIGNTDAIVPWVDGCDVEAGLGAISIAGPALCEMDGGLLRITIPPPRPAPPDWAGVPGDFVRLRHITSLLGGDVGRRLAVGEMVKSAELSPALRAHIEALICECVDGADFLSNCLSALQAGRTQLRFEPSISFESFAADCLPGECCCWLPVKGEQSPCLPDWHAAADWAEPVHAADESNAWPTGEISIKPGFYTLEQVVGAIRAQTSTLLAVQADYAGRGLYLNVQPTDAGALLRQVLDTACLRLLATDDGPVVGTGIPHGDIAYLHTRNLRACLENVPELTRVPADSMAARFASACIGDDDVMFEDLPEELQAWLRGMMPDGQILDTNPRMIIIPGFTLMSIGDWPHGLMMR